MIIDNITVNRPLAWDDLCAEAEKLDLLAVPSGDSFYFARTGPGPDAVAFFPLTDEGVNSAYTWLDSLEDDYYSE